MCSIAAVATSCKIRSSSTWLLCAHAPPGPCTLLLQKRQVKRPGPNNGREFWSCGKRILCTFPMHSVHPLLGSMPWL